MGWLKDILEFAEAQGFIRNLLELFRQPINCLVFGISGVGKTNFLKSLSSNSIIILSDDDKTMFRKRYGVTIEKIQFRFVDTPGDDMYSSERHGALIEAMNLAKFAVINVACYGFRERERYRSIAVSGTEIQNSFLSDSRKEEISAISEWYHIVSGARNMFVVTVVTKADLWWGDREKVLEHYEKGEYAKALVEKGINPAVSLYCSSIKKYYDVVPTSDQFDDKIRLSLKNSLMRNIVEGAMR